MLPDWVESFSTQSGNIRKVKNAICIHEEDDGILFKHTDFRDDSTIVTRARRLIVQQVFTAANYEYAIAWVFHQDGTIQPDIKLTGILNTYVMYPGEDTKGWGTEVQSNSVQMIDAVAPTLPSVVPRTFTATLFYAKRTKLETTAQAMTTTMDLPLDLGHHQREQTPTLTVANRCSYKIVQQRGARVAAQGGIPCVETGCVREECSSCYQIP
ncbi:hypothetical protein ACKAV7_014011 [Fusarium commune]